MADSVQNKRTQQTYLRQIQQEKAERKREIMSAQKEDMKSVRDYYVDQNKQLESDSAAAVNHIKDEARQIAAAERQERADRAESTAEQKRLDREANMTSNSTKVKPSSTPDESVEKKNLYTRKTPIIQNYETKETDDFYHVQNRGSRVSENPGNYVIEAYAPEHEKDNLRVSIQRNKAVVSGQRKFSDEAQDGNKSMHTNNYQSFREEFKFNRPVSQEGMTRERIGDYIRFSIPKLEALENPDEKS